jgi:predicted dienelactone hydrolase
VRGMGIDYVIDLALVAALAGCGGSSVEPDLAYEAPGMYAVRAERFEVVMGGRTLVVQAWLPSSGVAAPVPITSLEVEPVRARYEALLAAAPSCPSRMLPLTSDPPVAGALPLVLISHCHACTRLSNATTAVRLASHGFVAVSVEHAGDTLWELLDGVEAPLDTAELELRTGDVRVVLDAIAAGTTPVTADLTRIGVLGHSMGAVTAGRVAEVDARVSAAAALCAPVENPLIAGVTLANIDVPLLFVVAQEDNSITELGNLIARNNYRNAKHGAYKLEIPDAGHWSVSDLAGLVDTYKAGCGAAKRQTDSTEFTYLDPDTGRAITASYATAFFAATLRDEPGARAYVESASTSFGGVALDVQHH